MVRVLPLSMVDDILGIASCGNKSLALNTFINTHMEMKKLRFHTPDTTGKSKCHKIHVGKTNQWCPELKVHGSTMESVSSDTYLGDIISSNGSNTENIKARISRGNGIISKIRNILDSVSLGAHYFKIALLLRESLLLSSMLSSSESWYDLSTGEIEQLESVDITFLRSLFEVPHTVPTVSLYLETGCLSIGTILKCRRINFLHTIVNEDQTDMLFKFFHTQWQTEVKGDWTIEVKKNLKEFGIPQNLEFLRSKSKESFHNLVKKQAREYEFNRLLKIKVTRAKSKMKDIHYSEFKMQKYLELREMTASKAKVWFKFRVRMATFGENFRGGEATVMCPLCLSHPDGQAESFQCEKMKKLMTIKGDYLSIFSDSFPRELVQTVFNIYNFREEYRKLES